MTDRVKRPVNGSALSGGVAEVLSDRLFLIFCDVDRMSDQLVHAFVFGG